MSLGVTAASKISGLVLGKAEIGLRQILARGKLTPITPDNQPASDWVGGRLPNLPNSMHALRLQFPRGI